MMHVNFDSIELEEIDWGREGAMDQGREMPNQRN